jgi:hypothetical protein
MPAVVVVLGITAVEVLLVVQVAEVTAQILVMFQDMVEPI